MKFNMGFASGLPVIAGLVVGIAFVVSFSIYANTSLANSTLEENSRKNIVMKIENLKEAYRANEQISFTVTAKGISDNLCNFPEPSVGILVIDGGKRVWNTPPTFQTVMKCGTIQGIDRDWRFGYAGEELPFQSSLNFEHVYNNTIKFEEAGLYRIIATFEDNIVETDFAVVRADSGMQVSSEQLPDWTTIEVVIKEGTS